MSEVTDSNDIEDPWADWNLDDNELQNLLDDPLSVQDVSKLRTNEQHSGFDSNVGENWIYPNNLPCRAYQLSIAQAALYRNTLVVLPTGLGKTFIAAVVMYNIYRWYPTGKVIFMAPTRPLVAQQIKACQDIMPFPTKDTAELTGKLQRPQRAELWHTKRVFFATPQVVHSDICANNEEMHTGQAQFSFPFSQVKLIVVDEAHKAKGRYAYTEVVQAMLQRNRYFRVLALSATPGRTIEDVAEVVRNLLISHIEVRCDTSIDVMPYVHKRSLKTVVVPLGNDIKSIREELLDILDPYQRQLIEAEVLNSVRGNFNRNFILFEQKRFIERSRYQRHPQHSAVTTNFAICISTYHALELLERHGMRVFLNYFDEDEEGKSRFTLQIDRRLRELVDRLREKMGPNPFDVSASAMTNGLIPPIPQDLDFGHPKFEHARKCLVEHFKSQPDSRAIVFCEYRDSVNLIYRLLLQQSPLLRPRCFVGQGGTTGALRALSQKQQIQIMNDFRSGKSNILIATSIGEEGLDVGEVELIVCFDISTSNPTRFVQRIGRTGRKKQGKVVMLVTEGREQELLQDVLANKDETNRKLVRSSVVQRALYQHAPRLVPTEFNPQVIHTYISQDIASETVEKKKKKKKEPSKKDILTVAKTKTKAMQGSQDVRKFFQKAIELDAEEADMFQSPTGINTAQREIRESINKVKEHVKRLEESIPTNSFLQSLNSAKITNVKHLRKVNKFLKTTTLVPESQRVEDFLEQLKSPILSKWSKIILLKMRPELIKDVMERIKIVEALDVEYHTMSAEEVEIRENYELILSLFGGKVEITAFLEDIEYERPKHTLNTPQDAIEISDDEFTETCNKVFDGLDEQGFCCDNFDYIEEELKKTQRYNDFRAELYVDDNQARQAESTVYNTFYESREDETQAGVTEDYNITESKYCSQWEEFAGSDLPHKSTPLQHRKLEGPLAKAGRRQENLEGIIVLEKERVDKESQREEKAKLRMDLRTGDVSRIGTAEEEELERSLRCFQELLQASYHVEKENDVLDMENQKTIDETREQSFVTAHSLWQQLAADNRTPNKLDCVMKTENEANVNSGVGNSVETPASKVVTYKELSASIEDETSSKKKSTWESSNTTKNKPSTKCEPKMIQQSTPLATEISRSSKLSATAAISRVSLESIQKELSSLDAAAENKCQYTPQKILSNIISNEVTPKAIPLSQAKRTETSSQKPPSDSVRSNGSFNASIPLLPKQNQRSNSSPVKLMLDELELNMDAFMEPFPEERLMSTEPAKLAEFSPTRRSSLREIVQPNNLLAPPTQTCYSPDIFELEESTTSPSKPHKDSLNVRRRHSIDTSPVHSPRKIPKAKTPTTPKGVTDDSPSSKKSPSIFDLYLKKVARRKFTLTAPQSEIEASTSINLGGDQFKSVTTSPVTAKADSPIVVCKRPASKRRVFDTDSENEDFQTAPQTLDDSETGFEEIAATQEPESVAETFLQKRKRRRNLCSSFIEQEAAASGKEDSDNEAEETLGRYLLDSVVVQSDDEADDNNEAASVSHMQAMYLRSLKSPQKRRGAFKIPEFRVYNDQSQIYSQPILNIEPSQYMPDSFVVEEEDDDGELEEKEKQDSVDVSLCPLERAEQILKERRRAKRKFAEVAAVNKGKKRRRLAVIDSSDTESE